ncbi:MAG: deoxyribodipyrimidine photolyase [Pirellulaceae bacterium]|nr:deoxyribodipyrimidine photolyase [Pirellulaceae bacterium]
MTAFRRQHSNFALQRARDWSRQLGKPLIVLEALRIRYRWASDRMHRFVIEGMQDNSLDFANTVAHYYAYVEPKPGEGSGLLEALARPACLVVTDDYPCFFHPHMIKAVSRTLPCQLEVVDSNCLVPLSVWDRTFTVAHSYRRAMQKTLPALLDQAPEENPLLARSVAGIPPLKELPREITGRWPRADLDKLLSDGGLSKLAIDHSVAPAPARGGSRTARSQLKYFINQLLDRYNEDRNHPDLKATSQLSAHMHFGHISAHQVFWTLMQACRWNPERLSKPNGSMEGFWNVGPAAEAFLDQLCTWREIGFNMCQREPNYDRYESLPAWARQTLADHRDDPRPHIYEYSQLEQGRTSDRLWNAAQMQLVHEGRIHNYLRMMWGKKILEWTECAEDALEVMLELNNKFALDGRDPNSYSGIFWVLGRYDRAWGPERPIFGKVRYMTSENTARKVKLKEYLKQWSV